MIEGFNYDLSVETLASIEEDEEAHDQTQWAAASGDAWLFHSDNGDEFVIPSWLNVEESCHTAKCMAGHALTEAGVALDWTIDEWTDSKVYLSVEYTKDGTPIEAAARRVLAENDDLPLNEDITALFDVHNTLDDLYAYVADYAGRSVEDVRLDVKRTIEDRVAQQKKSKN